MTRPGMNDGRSFGDDMYKTSCNINKEIQGKMTNEEYRKYLMNNAEKIRNSFKNDVNASELMKY